MENIFSNRFVIKLIEQMLKFWSEDSSEIEEIILNKNLQQRWMFVDGILSW